MVNGCPISFWWLMIILDGLKMFSLWKRKPPWFTPDEIDDGDDDAYWGAENKSARTQAMRSNQRVRCTDVRWAMGKTIAENLFLYFLIFLIFFFRISSLSLKRNSVSISIYMTCLLIWPWGRLMIWSSQRRARKPSPEINDLKNCQSISTCASHGESH